jgi:hypothetical protein
MFAPEVQPDTEKPHPEPLPTVQATPAAMLLSFDLERCGIPVKDESGRVVDLHALRHTYITSLGKAGLPINVLQTLARHSDPKQTLNVYTHLSLNDMAGAVESLPDPFQAASQSQALAATGTDPSINDRFAPLLPQEEAVNCCFESPTDENNEPEFLSLSRRNPLGVSGDDGSVSLMTPGDAEKKDSSKKASRPITDLVLLVYS